MSEWADSDDPDRTEYGPYLVGDGTELHTLTTPHDTVTNALNGFQLYTVHERDLTSFASLEEIQEWLNNACELSQIKPQLRVMRGTHATQLTQLIAEQSTRDSIPTFHFEDQSPAGIHFHPLEKGIYTDAEGTQHWYQADHSSEVHGWEEPLLCVEAPEPGTPVIQEGYLCAMHSHIAHVLTGISETDPAPTLLYPGDLIVIFFSEDELAFVAPIAHTMLNVTVAKDGFETTLTGNYAPPRKRLLRASRAHREHWANWYDADAPIPDAQLHGETRRIEQLLTQLLAQETLDSPERSAP